MIKLNKFQINFDKDLLNNVFYVTPYFNTLIEVFDFLDSKTDKELYELYIKWCEEHSYHKEERLSENYFNSNKAIIIQELEYFVPVIDVDKVLEDISVSSHDIGGEYSDDYLNDVEVEHAKDLEVALNSVLSNWFKKHPHYKPEFKNVKNEWLYED